MIVVTEHDYDYEHDYEHDYDYKHDNCIALSPTYHHQADGLLAA